MCQCVKSVYLTAGWVCCGCLAYCGLQRAQCKQCDRPRCRPLFGDRDTGETFETYEEAYAKEPDTLATVLAELAKAAQREGRA